MPRISAPTVAENREQRRTALLGAAAALTLRSGTFTVAEVTAEVGLSRSAFYEYYSSAADLVADVLIDELEHWHDALAAATAGAASAPDRVTAWITAVLAYIADGRHALLRAAGSVELPQPRRDEVQRRHRALVQPLADALDDMGVPDAALTAALVWGAVDAMVGRIESGGITAEQAGPVVIGFVNGGLPALVRTVDPLP